MLRIAGGPNAQQRLVTETEIAVTRFGGERLQRRIGQMPALERRQLDLERDVQVYETLRLRCWVARGQDRRAPIAQCDRIDAPKSAELSVPTRC